MMNKCSLFNSLFNTLLNNSSTVEMLKNLLIKDILLKVLNTSQW